MSVRAAALEIAGDLLGSRGRRRLSWGRSVLYLLLIAASTGWWYRADLTASVPLPADGHAMMSVSIAVNRAFCGFPSRLSTVGQISQMYLEDHSLTEPPISSVIASKWGSVSQYCQTVTVPTLNNENSLMLALSWIMQMVPDVSLGTIGRILLVVRGAMVLLFGLALLRAGTGVLVSALVVEIAAAILHQLQPVFAYSVYSFFVPLTLLPMALYLLTAEASRRMPVRLAVALIGGVVSAYGTNMRTSYLPIYLALLGLYLLTGEWLQQGARRPLKQRLMVTVAAVVLFAAGYGAFQYSLIIRSREPGAVGPSYHVIWHSVVISLGAPANPLSEREGIKWLDGTGWELARRINPAVPYLGPGYEEALSQYYFSLWKKYPGEMRQIYIEKFKLGGRHMVENASFHSRWLTWMLGALAYLPNGIWMLAGLVAVFVGALWRYARSGNAGPLVFLYVSCCGVLLLTEASAIMPFYYLTYQSNLLFACTAVVTLLLGRVVLGGPAWLIARVAGTPEDDSRVRHA